VPLLHDGDVLFNGPLSGTNWVSRYQKGKTDQDFIVARDNEWQWHQLGHMQVSTLLQVACSVSDYCTFMISSRSSSHLTNTLLLADRGSDVDSVTASCAKRRARDALLMSPAAFTFVS